MLVPFARPDRNDADKAAMCEAYDSGWWTSGPWTKRLEDMAKELTKSRHCIGVNSATTAAMMALRFRIERRRPLKLFAPAIGSHFFLNAALWAGYPRDEFWLLDCDETLGTVGRPFGIGLDYGSHRLEHDATAIIDNAYGLGGRNEKARGWCEIFSGQATKPCTGGEFGLLCTDDDDFAAWCRQVRSHGMQASSYERGEGDYEVVTAGGGFLLPDILAAVVVSQLSRSENMRARRIEIARRYDAALAPAIAAGRVIPVPRDYAADSLGLYALRILSATGYARDKFRRKMLELGVSTRNHYRAIWENPAYEFLREQGERDCPLAARVSREVVTLPLSSALTDEEVQHVCASLTEVLA